MSWYERKRERSYGGILKDGVNGVDGLNGRVFRFLRTITMLM